MGAERVSELSAHNEGVEGQSSAPISYREIFDELCPWYMSIGMTYDEFWYGEPERAKYYRKAHELKRKEMNERLYIQGMYFYEALCDVAPVLVTMPKKGAKIVPYVSEPYPLTEAEQKAQKEREAKRKQEAMLKRFTGRAMAFNVNKTKGGGNDG